MTFGNDQNAIGVYRVMIMSGRFLRCLTICLLLLPSVMSAQNLEAGRVDRHGDQAVLIVDGPRPVDSAAITLAQEFGIAVSVEDPPYIFPEDMKDVTDGVTTADVSRVPNPQRRVLIPKGGRLEIRFALKPDGSPQDLPGLLRDLIAAANARFLFTYRLDADGTRFTIVPTLTRNALGKKTDVTPLLDRRVTIPAGTRSIADTAALMADALSAQTGLRVYCCQGAVRGIPRGMAEIPFEANNEPARNVLIRLISAAAPGQSDRAYWLQRCDTLPSNWCFINLAYTNVGRLR